MKIFESSSSTKIISFGIACFLWLFVGIQNPETEFVYRGVPVVTVMQNAQVENGVTPIGTGGETVDITLKGNKNVLTRIKAEDLYATIEVDAAMSPGNYSLPINVSLPVDNVIITGKQPMGINVRLDRMKTVAIPVVVNQISSLDSSFLVEEPEVSPEIIEVRGPSAEVDTISRAVVNFEINDRNLAEKSVSTAYDLIDHSGHVLTSAHLTMSVRSVEVRLNIFQRKTLPVRVNILNLPQGWSEEIFSYGIEPEAVSFLLPSNEVGGTTSYFAGDIDLSAIESSSAVTFPVSPEYISVGESSEIKVSLKFGDMRSVTAPLQRISFDNTPSGAVVEIVGEGPSVRLRGAPADVDEYEAGGFSKLRGTVDVAGLEVGEQAELPVKITTGDAGIGFVGTVKVTVRIAAQGE